VNTLFVGINIGLNLKPDHKAIKAYCAELDSLTGFLNAKSEGAISAVFANLLRHCAGKMNHVD
jgi:hypothetical protein